MEPPSLAGGISDQGLGPELGLVLAQSIEVDGGAKADNMRVASILRRYGWERKFLHLKVGSDGTVQKDQHWSYVIDVKDAS